MMNKLVTVMGLILLLFSCEQSGMNTSSDKPVEQKEALDLEHKSDVKHGLSAGQKAFKQNCAVCHCPPVSNCEPSGIPHLKSLFKGLPADSLVYYEAFVKNSISIRKNASEAHEFGKTLQDSTIRSIIEFVWRTSQP